MGLVRNTIKRPGGAPASGRVVIELLGDGGRPAFGYVSADDYTIEAYDSFVADGEWTRDLVANSLIKPAGTRWRVTETVDGVPAVHHLLVPVGPGPFFVEDIPSEAPASVASPALQAHADLTDTAHGGLVHPNLAAHDALGLATQVELDAEAAARANADNLLIPLTQKGAAGGVTPLGADQKIAGQYLPALALSEFLGNTASQAAMLALVGQRGDWTIRTDLGGGNGATFILVADDASVLANWKQLPTAADAVLSVNGRAGVVTGLVDSSAVGTVGGPAGPLDAQGKIPAAQSATIVPRNTVTTAAYTAVLTDAGKVVRTAFAGASTLTIPANATTAFPLDTVINAYAAGGALTIAAATGVTIRNNGAAVAQFGEVSLRKDAADEWVRTG